MRVATLLKKDREGKLFHKHGYKLEGETNFQGLDIAIENAKGSLRKGTNPDGTKWETRFHTPYGYLRGTKGADNDPVDCYVGRDADSQRVFVARQKKDDGSYDEDTVMLGYGSAAAAKKDILQHYDDPKYIGNIVPMSIGRLKKLVDSGKKLEKISGITHDQTFIDGDDPGVTGRAAVPRRRRNDVPSREDVDPNPTPRTEQRGDITSTSTVGAFNSPGGFDDVGKSGSPARDQLIADALNQAEDESYFDAYSDPARVQEANRSQRRALLGAGIGGLGGAALGALGKRPMLGGAIGAAVGGVAGGLTNMKALDAAHDAAYQRQRELRNLPPDFTVKGAALETLGQAVRSWEGPSDDSPSVHGGQRQGSGGLIEAPSPGRTAEDQEMRGPFHFSLSEIGSSASQDGGNTKGAAATNRFPKANRVEDNTLDVQTMGDRASALDKAATVFGFGPDGEFYVNHELVPVREHRSEKLAHITLQAFFAELEKLSAATGLPLDDPEQFRKVASDLYYVTSSVPLIKEALGLASIGQGLSGIGQGIGQGVKAVAGRLLPGAAAGAARGAGAVAAEAAPNFRKGMGFFSTGMGRDLHAGGKMLAHNSQAAGQAAGLGARDVSALGAMKPSSAAGRIAGETAIGAGHHMEHAGAGLMALNPVGVPMGGAIEGFTRGVGKELQNVGHQGVQSAGRLLQKHAPKVGFGGELLAGGMLHAPGLAATIGGAAAPGAAEAVQHLVGAGAQEAITRGPKFLRGRMGMA